MLGVLPGDAAGLRREHPEILRARDRRRVDLHDLEVCGELGARQQAPLSRPGERMRRRDDGDHLDRSQRLDRDARIAKVLADGDGERAASLQ